MVGVAIRPMDRPARETSSSADAIDKLVNTLFSPPPPSQNEEKLKMRLYLSLSLSLSRHPPTHPTNNN